MGTEQVGAASQTAAASSRAQPGMSSASAIRFALIVSVLGGAAFALIGSQVRWADPIDPPMFAAGTLLMSSFLFFGVFVAKKRPGDRVGLLMIAVAGAFSLPAVAWISTDLTQTLANTFFLQLWLVVLGHLFLAFPTGTLRSRFERGLVIGAYVWWFVVNALTVAVLDPATMGWSFDNPFRVIGSPEVERLIVAVEALVSSALALLFLFAIVRHWFGATSAGRRILAPVVWASVPTFVVVVSRLFEGVFGLDMQVLTDGAAGLLALTALPVGFAIGLLRSRLGRSRVGELVVELGEAQAPGRVRDRLATILRDPMLRIAYRRSGSPGYVDETGQPVSIDRASLAVTPIERGGEEIAVLLHDPAASGDPELLRSAVAATRLAVENERLAAELLARFEEVRASRVRIVEAGDAERRRVERNLHDGAQQRLLTLSISMRQLRDRLPAETDPAVRERLGDLVGRLQHTIDELRELAHGIHPAILTEEGVAGAVASLADRSAVPVTIRRLPDGRFSDAVEETVYLVVAETVANAARRARAGRVSVSIVTFDGVIGVEVSDDGGDGPDPAGDPALRGLIDRVEAVGGRLAVERPSEAVTIVRAEVPIDAA